MSVERSSALMRRVNREMRDRSRTFESSESIPFFCECRSEGCYSVIWLSAAGFDALTSARQGEWIIQAGHEAGAAEQLPVAAELASRVGPSPRQPRGASPARLLPKRPFARRNLAAG
jgi:hypothetical protein